MDSVNKSYFENNDCEYLKYLIESGKVDINWLDRNGNNRLHVAIQYSKNNNNKGLDIIEMLLEKKIKTDVISNAGFTAARIYSNKEIYEILLKYDKEMFNVGDKNNDTIFHFIAERNDTAIIKLFIESGIRYDIKNNNGKTAYDLCPDKSLFPKTIDMIMDDINKYLSKEDKKTLVLNIVSTLAV